MQLSVFPHSTQLMGSSQGKGIPCEVGRQTVWHSERGTLKLSASSQLYKKKKNVQLWKYKGLSNLMSQNPNSI